MAFSSKGRMDYAWSLSFTAFLQIRYCMLLNVKHYLKHWILYCYKIVVGQFLFGFPFERWTFALG